MPAGDVVLNDRTASDDEQAPPETLTTTLSVRVVLGPFRPSEPGSGFIVLVQGPTGAVARGVTDGEGRLSMDVPSDSGPWDMTVARPGFLLVSLLSMTSEARAPISATVYTQALTERRQALAPRVITAHFTGAAQRSVASVWSRSLVDSEYASDPDWTLTQHDDRRPGLGALRVWAIEWLSDGDQFPLRPLRAKLLATVPPEQAGPLDFSVDFSRPDAQSVQSTLQVSLPTMGVLTRDTIRRGAPSRVQFAFTHEDGAWYPSYAVGTITADYVRDAVGPTITVAHFANELRPDGAEVTYASNAPSEIELQIWPRNFTDGSTIAVPVVQSLATSGPSLDRVEIEAVGSDYAPGFSVFGNDGQIAGWVGFSVNNSAISRRVLPRLPPEIVLRQHFRGSSVRVVSTLTRRTDRAVQPWEPGGSRAFDLEADSAFVTVPIP
jgi:hypothetical protein